MSAATPDDGRWLDAAARYAQPYLGTTGGRPLAAALVVDADGLILGRGVSTPASTAEQAAIQTAGPGARGATLFATLEPLADPLVDAGIARLVVGIRHPDPMRSGRTNTRLRDAGIDVTLVDHGPSRSLIEPPVMRTMRRRPFFTIVLPISKDGMIGSRDGSGVALGDTARRWLDLQLMRADATITHVNDMLELSMTARANATWHVSDRGIRPDVPAALSDLVARDASSVAVLPDAPLAEALVGAGLADRLHLLQGHAELGRDGIPATALGTIEGRLRAARLAQTASLALGVDTLRTYEPER